MRSRILLLKKKITLTCSHRVGFPPSKKLTLGPDNMKQEQKSSGSISAQGTAPFSHQLARNPRISIRGADSKLCNPGKGKTPGGTASNSRLQAPREGTQPNYLKLAEQQRERACPAGLQGSAPPRCTIHSRGQRREGGSGSPALRPSRKVSHEARQPGRRRAPSPRPARTLRRVNADPPPPPPPHAPAPPRLEGRSRLGPLRAARPSPPSPVARRKCAGRLRGVRTQPRRDTSSVKATGGSQGRQGATGPQTRGAAEAAGPTAATTGTGEGARRKGRGGLYPGIRRALIGWGSWMPPGDWLPSAQKASRGSTSAVACPWSPKGA